MRSRKYVETITFKLSLGQRKAIESLASQEELSVGEATRKLLDAGIQARGILNVEK